MTLRLSAPLGSYADRDEFQVGRLLIFVKYGPDGSRTRQLNRAEDLLPVLEAEIPKVEEMATEIFGSEVRATVIGIWIEPDGLASYDCTFFEGEHEDELISIRRRNDGRLLSKDT